MKNVILTALLLTMCFGLKAQEIKELPFKSGEEIELVVSFQASMWPKTNMAKLTVNVSDDMLGDSLETYRIAAYARTTAFRWIYKMDSYYMAWLDMQGKPVKASTEINEGSYVYNNDYRYDLDNGKVYMRWSKPGRYDNILDTLNVTSGARDMISLIYHMRSVDPDTMGEGVDHELELLSTDKVKTIKYRFQGHEVKKIKPFGELNTLHFSCEITMRDGTEFEKGNDLHVWLTDDPNKIPLLIESPIRWGRVKAVLDSYKNLKFQDDSVLQ